MFACREGDQLERAATTAATTVAGREPALNKGFAEPDRGWRVFCPDDEMHGPPPTTTAGFLV